LTFARRETILQHGEQNMTTRLNQNDPAFNWSKFVDAVDQIHGVGQQLPRYRDFVMVHVNAMSSVGMSWNVHSMQMPNGMNMKGTNFLAWHRWLLHQFEQRLQKVDASVSIPYWNAVTDPQIPAALSDAKLLKRWGVKRKWNPSQLPAASSLSELDNLKSFDQFQTLLEADYHNSVHRAAGGDMVTSASPNDPMFWLHHAMIDRIWADWQAKSGTSNPLNTSEVLKPSPMFGVKVSETLKIAKLGYAYK
jgi:tyrosinase